ncbi:MAG: sigma-70 family RNA polymerase sigma factor [Mariniphaga sp.]|nr:sigma-70 family RNA polymerase sigma factor [Mariniphaga sp.]
MEKDVEIWRKFKAGDKSALTDVYLQNFNSMFQYGIKFKDDPDFIKDCIQEVFCKLIQAGTKLGETENIRYYLFKALKNSILKGLGRTRKIESLETDVLKFDASFSLEEEIERKENSTFKEKALLKALSRLSDHQREIIYLRYDSGLEYEQICDLMDLKYDSARKLIFRTIKLLRETIEGEMKLPILFLFRFR